MGYLRRTEESRRSCTSKGVGRGVLGFLQPPSKLEGLYFSVDALWFSGRNWRATPGLPHSVCCHPIPDKLVGNGRTDGRSQTRLVSTEGMRDSHFASHHKERGLFPECITLVLPSDGRGAFTVTCMRMYITTVTVASSDFGEQESRMSLYTRQQQTNTTMKQLFFLSV